VTKAWPRHGPPDAHKYREQALRQAGPTPFHNRCTIHIDAEGATSRHTEEQRHALHSTPSVTFRATPRHTTPHHTTLKPARLYPVCTSISTFLTLRSRGVCSVVVWAREDAGQVSLR